MDRQTVEDKDRDVIKKFRSVVEVKELKKKQHQGRMKLLTGLAVVCSLAVLLFVNNYLRQKPLAVAEKETGVKEFSKEESSAALSSMEPGQQTPAPVKKDSVNTDTTGLLETPISKDARGALKRPQYPKNIQEIQAVPLVVVESKKILPRATQKKTITDAVKVSKISACREVEEKRCATTQNEFSVKRDGKVYIWMDVRSRQLPQKLRHIYFVNGRRYRSIPLSVIYPQMRTWSGIKLNGSQDVGKWRVDVVSEQGQTLSHIDFRVVP